MNQNVAMAHQEAERIFRVLLPQNGLVVREQQLALCHEMLDALFCSQVLISDAGVGIGKTYAYLVAGILLRKYGPKTAAHTIVISTSGVALQDSIVHEYLPFLARILLKNQVIQNPIRAVVRKGRERFVCDRRLQERIRDLGSAQSSRKGENRRETLLSLQTYYDLDAAAGLSQFDRQMVCVPKFCPHDCAKRKTCRYLRYLERAREADIFIQICNHNYLLADAAHRDQGMRPLLNDYRALIIDEAHKMPDAGRQMYGESLSQGAMRELCDLFSIHAGQRLWERFANLLIAVQRGEMLESEQRTPFVLTAEREAALQSVVGMLKQIEHRTSDQPRWITARAARTERFLNRFISNDKAFVLYLEYDRAGVPTLCAASRQVPEQLHQALWRHGIPAVLTSGTMCAGRSFARTQQVMGLKQNEALRQFRAASPFEYKRNCLLYFPVKNQEGSHEAGAMVEDIAQQIIQLLQATSGHTLVLFTSYSMMGAVYNLLEWMRWKHPCR